MAAIKLVVNDNPKRVRPIEKKGKKRSEGITILKISQEALDKTWESLVSLQRNIK